MLKAKLDKAEDAELQSQRSERKSQLKPYTGRFQRPGDEDRGANSRRNMTDHRVKSHDSFASWRKKDSCFVRPSTSEAHDKDDGSHEDRKQEESAADVKRHKVSRSSETLCSQSRPRKPAESCNYAHIIVLVVILCSCVMESMIVNVAASSNDDVSRVSVLI